LSEYKLFQAIWYQFLGLNRIEQTALVCSYILSPINFLNLFALDCFIHCLILNQGASFASKILHVTQAEHF